MVDSNPPDVVYRACNLSGPVGLPTGIFLAGDFAMDERAKQEASGTAGSSREEKKKGEQGPKVSFQEFVYLLSSQVLIQLGIAPNPATGKAEENLPAAQHAIEILAMLEQKTKGNLTPEEGKVLTNALYDLRMRYVQSVQARKADKKAS